MGIEIAKEGKLIYHLTSLEHLESIIKHGLLSRNDLIRKHIKFNDIANQEIIEKRSRQNLDEYVPFHFHPYSSFDFAVQNNNKDTTFIYLCVLRETARRKGYKILPAHPVSNEAMDICDYDEGLKKIDWDTMTTYGITGNYAKHVKMAECLSEDIVPIEDVFGIAVPDKVIQRIVEDELKQAGIDKPPHVDIQKAWFTK